MNDYKLSISNECCYELKDIGNSIEEFVLMQNIKWLDILDCFPVSNVFNLLNIKYKFKNYNLYIDYNGYENIKVKSINKNIPAKELSKNKLSYVIETFENKMKNIIVSRPNLENVCLKNNVVYYGNKVYIKLVNNSFVISNIIKCDDIYLDLRNNSGGKITDLQRIIGYFVGNKVIIDIVSDNKKYFYLRSKGIKTIFFKKVYVIINENTASAAEIICKFMKEKLNAIVIGNKSKGKLLLTSVKKFDNLFVKIPMFKVISCENYEQGIEPDNVNVDIDILS